MTLQVKIVDANASNFSKLYNDQGSSGDANVQFWKANSQGIFLAAGDICEASPSDWIYGTGAPLGQVILLAPDPVTNDGVKNPDGFTQIWTDAGSGADLEGTIWAMIPPKDHVALGYCCTFSTSGTPPQPDRTQYYCVHKSLVTPGGAGAQIWNDSGTGSNTDVSIYATTATSFFVDLHTFWAVAGSLGPPSGVQTAVLLTSSVNFT